MKGIIYVLAIFALTLSLITPAFSDEDKDFAVPAFSDLPLLGGAQSQTPQKLTLEPPQPEFGHPMDVKQLQWLDLNRDLQLNEFDIKQFQSVIESLNGEKLTGLQITIRFKEEQKNQRESFPLLYDLDRDGMFTAYDVDYFTEVVNRIDEGALHGSELIQKYRFQIFPQQPTKNDQPSLRSVM